jgi:UDP:flavonoid glycosyltransferase YjiC (YdhE family)
VRVLIAATPGTGHLHPVVPLALALRRRGHDVTWATARSGHAVVERYGFEPVAAGLDLAERGRCFQEHFPDGPAGPPRQRRPAAFAGIFATVAAPRMAADLEPIVDRVRPQVVVHEVAELASAPIARQAGVPSVSLAFSGLLPPSVVAAAAPAIAPVWEARGLAVPDDLGLFDDLYLHPFPGVFGQRPEVVNVHPLRPEHADGGDGFPSPAWLLALGNDRPAVWVTFGTEMATAAPWSSILEAAGAMEADVVCTVGNLDPSVLGATPGNVRVERYIPQRFLLDRVAAVVSHGGANTALAVAARGLPQVVVPLGADQWENADAVAGAGAGLTLEAGGRDVAAIGAALRHVLADQSYRVNAHIAAAQIAAMPDAVDVASRVEALVI